MPPTIPRPTPSPQRVLTLALLAWATYTAARTGLQALLPVSDMASYLEQDTLITLLRLGCLGFCYWLGRQRYSRESFHNLPGRPGLAWSVGLWMVGFYTLSWFSRAYAPFSLWNAGARMVELAIALIVAANEEVGWRGAIFEPLRELWGPAWALALTVAGFTLMHVGYQPLETLPRIALTAAVLGLGRWRGLSLGSLILIHFGIDGSLALYQPEGAYLSMTPEYVCTGAIGLAAVSLYFVKPKPLEA
jgi:membrane protease YdiL (CAAX protease family)